MERVRDRFWLWGHEASSHNPGTGPEEWNLPRPSRITPVEAAFDLGIPNLLMVRYNGRPQMPYDQLTVPMRRLQRIVWSITGAMGEVSVEEQEHVLSLTRRTPNITGLVMDDFLNWDTGQPEVTLDRLAAISQRIRAFERPLDLMMVLYSHQLDADIAGHLLHCTQASFWVWNSRDLESLESSFGRFEDVAADVERYLGCYVWDFGARAPMPLDRFVGYCETGLRWLRTGRVAGLIFLPSCHCDLGLDTVEWLRSWIDAVGDDQLHV